MDTRYRLHNIAFEWNNRKAKANLRKHNIPFELACEAFFDPFVSHMGEETVDEEARESILGMTTNWRLLYVVYTLRGDIVRIVSARLATKSEKRKYENP